MPALRRIGEQAPRLREINLAHEPRQWLSLIHRAAHTRLIRKSRADQISTRRALLAEVDVLIINTARSALLKWERTHDEAYVSWGCTGLQLRPGLR